MATIHPDLIDSLKTAEIRQLKRRQEELRAELYDVEQDLKKSIFLSRNVPISRNGRVTVGLFDDMVFFYEVPLNPRIDLKVIGGVDLSLLEEAISNLKASRRRQ